MIVKCLTNFADSKIAPVLVFEKSSLGYAQGWASFQLPSKLISAVQIFPNGYGGDPWGPTMAVGAPDSEYAQPGSAVLAASVYMGENAQFTSSLDIFYQPNGSGIIECLDIDNQYYLSWLAVGNE